MLTNIFRNWFPSARRAEFAADRFNHCASVCAHKKGVLMAWYAGTMECMDDQGVHIIYVDKNQQSPLKRIGDKTGNPVLIPYGKDAILLWSKFEDIHLKYPRRVPARNVDRWKYCSLWLQWIRFDGSKIKLLGDPKQLAGPEQHLLGRCNPIILSSGQYLLPLYDELGRQGVIYSGDGWDFEPIGRIGRDMIQPTLWVTSNHAIQSLSRNFGKQGRMQFYSHHSYSKDFGQTWSQPKPTLIFNRNSSLHTINWYGTQLLLWNNTQNIRRVDMALGIMDGARARPVCIMEAYGAYPSMCIDHNGDLNMAYTSANRTITHHVWNHKHFNKIARGLV